MANKIRPLLRWLLNKCPYSVTCEQSKWPCEYCRIYDVIVRLQSALVEISELQGSSELCDAPTIAQEALNDQT